MFQENDHDFRDQHEILVLLMLTNPEEYMVIYFFLFFFAYCFHPNVLSKTAVLVHQNILKTKMLYSLKCWCFLSIHNLRNVNETMAYFGDAISQL